eukprot:1144144-Pelagomonas_calceolata.AAC.3
MAHPPSARTCVPFQVFQSLCGTQTITFRHSLHVHISYGAPAACSLLRPPPKCPKPLRHSDDP